MQLNELPYDQLTEAQQAVADTAKVPETATSLYLVTSDGKVVGYRAAEMFDSGKPIKWSLPLDLATAERLVEKKGFVPGTGAGNYTILGYEVGKFDERNWEVRAVVKIGSGSEFRVTVSKHAEDEDQARARHEELSGELVTEGSKVKKKGRPAAAQVERVTLTPGTPPVLASQPTTDVAESVIQWVPYGLIDRCPLNPRKKFDRVRLDELKENIRVHGFIVEMSHLWVRPHPTQPNRFELIDGERRWIVIDELCREESFAGLVPITISKLTDVQVLEYALINAMQREQLSPIEEAEGICKWLEMPDATGKFPTVLEVAGRIACTPDHIKECKLLRRLRDTPAGVALEDSRFSKKHALMLARVANAKVRDDLTRRALNPSDGRGAVSREILQTWIESEVQVDLGSAKFDLYDPDLVPLELNERQERICGGACGEPNTAKGADRVTWTCPFVEVTRGSAKCLNPVCFRAKQSADYKNWRTEVEGTGVNVVTIELDEADKLWDHTGKRLVPNSGYVEMPAKPEEWLLKGGGDPDVQTWRRMLKGKAVPILMVKDRAGSVHELAKRDLAMQAARDAGFDIFKGNEGAEPAEAAAPAEDDDGDPRIAAAAESVQVDQAREEAQKKQAREKLIADRTARGLSLALMESARGMKKFSREFWHLILSPLVDFVKEQGELGSLCATLGKADHLTNPVDNEDFLDKTVKGTPEVHLPSLVLIIARHTLYPGEVDDWMKLACRAFSVDSKGVRKKVVAEIEQEEAASAERAEIENGVAWSLPLLEKVDEFSWLPDGDCANSNVAVVALPKSGSWQANVATARTHKGWHYGYELRHGKKIVAQALPNQRVGSYLNAALATKTALLALAQSMTDHEAPMPGRARVAAYIDSVKLPAEKPKGNAYIEKMSKPKAGKKPAKKKAAAKKGGSK